MQLGGHATVDLGIQSLTRNELTQLLDSLQGQRNAADQPLFTDYGATLVVDNAVLNDLLAGQSQADPMVQSILSSLAALGVNQLDGVDTAQASRTASLSASQKN